jgi:transcriptional regulator with XRE-family HTH domain
MSRLESIDDLKAWRQRLGLTQEGLAGALGTTRVTVGRWESGVRAWPPFLGLALLGIEVEQSVSYACGLGRAAEKGNSLPPARKSPKGKPKGGLHNGRGGQREG